MARDTEIIYGYHPVRHMLEKRPERVLNVCIRKDKKSSPELDALIRLAEQWSIHIDYLPATTLDRFSKHAPHQGILIHCRGGSPGKEGDLDLLLAQTTGSPPLFLVLDCIQDPHNLGACIRTANAAGVLAVIVPRDKSASITPAVRKAASGAVDETAVIRVTNLARTLRKLKDSGIWIAGLDSRSGESFYDLDLTTPLAVVVGGEGSGLRDNTRKNCDHIAGLPMQGNVESLNVSVAAGICLYEVLRRRQRG